MKSDDMAIRRYIRIGSNRFYYALDDDEGSFTFVTFKGARVRVFFSKPLEDQLDQDSLDYKEAKLLWDHLQKSEDVSSARNDLGVSQRNDLEVSNRNASRALKKRRRLFDI